MVDPSAGGALFIWAGEWAAAVVVGAAPPGGVGRLPGGVLKRLTTRR